MWFTAVLLFEDVVDSVPESRRYWEERIILVRADTDAEAARIAAEIGARENCSYVAANGDEVRVEFRQVDQVQALIDDVASHGSVLFSRHLRRSEVDSLLMPFDESE